MIAYAVRRAIQAVFILFALSIAFFVLLKLTGGPCDHYLAADIGGRAAQARYNACFRLNGLGEPWPVQYASWLSQTAQGNLGLDSNHNPIGDDLVQRIPATIILIITSYILQELLAFPVGLLGALKRYSIYDYVCTVLSYIGLCLPTFWLALMLQIVFAVDLGWSPIGGIIDMTSNPPIPDFGTEAYWAYVLTSPLSAVGDIADHLALPAVTLAIVGIATDSRFVRASMLDVINQDYIRTARAKGLPRRTVVLKHALRNALLPIITNVGTAFIPSLVSGSIVVEYIFQWPGMGQLYQKSASPSTLDSRTLEAILLLAALFVIIGNLVADLAYGWADPRIRHAS